MSYETSSEELVIPQLRHRRFWNNATQIVSTDAGDCLIPAPVSITTVSRDGSTVTCVTAAKHYLTTGQKATIAGFTTQSGAKPSIAYLNGSYPVTVPDGDVDRKTFTFTLPDGKLGGASLTGDITEGATVKFGGICQAAYIYCPTDNANSLWIGPSIEADFMELQPGDTYEIRMLAEKKFNLANWYFKSSADDLTGVESKQRISVLFV